MQRETVVLWITKVIGGRGHFGIDLILDSGKNPCIGRTDGICRAPTYYRTPLFGKPEYDALFEHGVWIPNSESASNGEVVEHNIAKQLSSAWLEFYPYNKIERVINGQPQMWPEFMHAKTSVNSFNHVVDGRNYSSHIGEVSLPRVNYNPGNENYGLLNGYITKKSLPTSDAVEVALFQEGPSIYSSSTGWPLYGFMATGNNSGYYSTGPVIPAKYKVILTHWENFQQHPEVNKRKELVLDILKPYERVDFDVADF